MDNENQMIVVKEGLLLVGHRHHEIEGWCHFFRPYREAVRKLEAGVMVEVGVYAGQSFAFLVEEVLAAKKQADLRLVAVDDWSQEPRVRDEFYAHARAWRKAGARVVVIEGRSVDVARLMRRKSLDFVWIDAAHDYDSVRQDVAVWLPTVAPGGVIGGDDYHERCWPGLCRAVRESFPPGDVEGGNDENDSGETWWWRVRV